MRRKYMEKIENEKVNEKEGKMGGNKKRKVKRRKIVSLGRGRENRWKRRNEKKISGKERKMSVGKGVR